jgi:calcium channel MID1
MPLPKLSLLQSRLATSLIASLMLLILYFALLSHTFAYAADVDSIPPQDHNHEWLLDADRHRSNIEDFELGEEGLYQADFPGYDEGIIGRAATSDSPTQLENNVPRADNLAPGQTNFYMFPGSELGLRVREAENQYEDNLYESSEKAEPTDPELRLRQRDTSSRVVFVSVNVCSQPKPVDSTTVATPPQLQLYISQTSSNSQPGPGSNGVQQSFDLVEGATMQQVTATGDIYFGLYGANSTDYEDMWNAEIAVSTDGYYHTYHIDSGPNLRLVDSDSSAALLITGNLTNESSSSPAFHEVMNAGPRYVLFASNSNNRAIQGLQNSYCGLSQNADIKPLDSGQNPGNVQASLTTRGQGVPRQQFYINGITSGTTYTSTLAVYGGGNSSTTTRRAGVVGGGGQVWPATSFTTLAGMSI